MLYGPGLASVIYLAVWGRKKVSYPAFFVAFVIFGYITYSFLWSENQTINHPVILQGTIANFKYSVNWIFQAWLAASSGLAISLASCALLATVFPTVKLSKAKFLLNNRIPFIFSMVVTVVAMLSLGLVVATTHSTEEARSAGSNPIAYLCENLFILPLALGVQTKNSKMIRISLPFVIITAGLGLLSGRTTFLAVSAFPLFVVYMSRISETSKWTVTVGKVFLLILISVSVLQVFRGVRALRSSQPENPALAIQNSFTEILVLSRVMDVLSLRRSFIEQDLITETIDEILPAALAGPNKDYYFNRYKADHYVGRHIFEDRLTGPNQGLFPVTVFGDGWLMYGYFGVTCVGVLVGLIMFIMQCALAGATGLELAGLIICSSLIHAARNGLSEMLITALAGMIIILAIRAIEPIVAPLGLIPRWAPG